MDADAIAGFTLGIESVPDGLAGGLLAGLNPLYGLHAYFVGTLAGGLSTSSAFMAVQATGPMAIVIAHVEAVHTAADPGRAVFTLAVVTGALMIVAGFLHLGARKQLDVTGTTAVIGDDNIYAGEERVRAALRRAYDDAEIWISNASTFAGAPA